MAALTGARPTPNVVQSGIQGGAVVDVGVMASQQIYQGSFVSLDSTGYLQPASTDTAGEIFVGLAISDSLGGAVAGGTKCPVLTGSMIRHDVVGAVVTSVGVSVYASDDQTLTTTSAGNPLVGYIVSWVSGTTCVVQMLSPTGLIKFPVVEAHSSGDTLLPSESGSMHTNAGALGAVTLVLPAATIGLEFKFKVGSAQQLRLDPNGSETIALPSTGIQAAAGKYIWADAAGETVYVVCDTVGEWSVYGFTGTWAAQL